MENKQFDEWVKIHVAYPKSYYDSLSSLHKNLKKELTRSFSGTGLDYLNYVAFPITSPGDFKFSVHDFQPLNLKVESDKLYTLELEAEVDCLAINCPSVEHITDSTIKSEIIVGNFDGAIDRALHNAMMLGRLHRLEPPAKFDIWAWCASLEDKPLFSWVFDILKRTTLEAQLKLIKRFLTNFRKKIRSLYVIDLRQSLRTKIRFLFKNMDDCSDHNNVLEMKNYNSLLKTISKHEQNRNYSVFAGFA